MPNIKNLKPYQPGQSGNKAGRPVSDIRKAIREAISEPLGNHQTTLDAMINRMIQMSMKGSIKATELLLSYAYGKPKGETPEIFINEVILPKCIRPIEEQTED